MLVLALVASAGALAAATAGDEIAVRVDVREETVSVGAELTIAATPCEVWAVLTDFERLPQFVSNIAVSKVLARDGNSVRVAQTGKTSFGPLTFHFESERELKLTACERIESHMLSGNMKRFHGSTRLEAAEGRTRLRYHSEAVPATPVPPGIGRSLIEAETREHYRDISREVLRRKTATISG